MCRRDLFLCHSREEPVLECLSRGRESSDVKTAKTLLLNERHWIPAFAGMTVKRIRNFLCSLQQKLDIAVSNQQQRSA